MNFGPRTLIFFILLLAMPVASYFYMFKPMNDDVIAIKARTAKKQETLNELHSKMAHIKDMAAEVEKLRKAVAFFESKLPEAKEMDKVLREVWQNAEHSGLTIKSVRNLKVIDGPNYSEQPIKMVIYGPMKDGFYKFVSEVEKLQRLTRINEMTITADDKKPGCVTVEMVLTIYFDASQKVAVSQ